MSKTAKKPSLRFVGGTDISSAQPQLNLPNIDHLTHVIKAFDSIHETETAELLWDFLISFPQIEDEIFSNTPISPELITFIKEELDSFLSHPSQQETNKALEFIESLSPSTD